MSTADTLPEDRSIWQGDSLVYDSWNEFRDGDPHRQETFKRAEPCGAFCYWCAMGGESFALQSAGRESCIATVESALRASNARRNESQGLDSVYVIWQPKDHGDAAWRRWSKNWSKRTALRPA